MTINPKLGCKLQTPKNLESTHNSQKKCMDNLQNMMNIVVRITNHYFNKLQTPKNSKNDSQLTKEVHGQTTEHNEHHNAHDQSPIHQTPESLENNQHSQRSAWIIYIV
jgi:hypothetical protein